MRLPPLSSLTICFQHSTNNNFFDPHLHRDINQFSSMETTLDVSDSVPFPDSNAEGWAAEDTFHTNQRTSTSLDPEGTPANKDRWQVVQCGSAAQQLHYPRAFR